MFKLVQTHGIGGDCTAPYDVEFDKPYTVSEFINSVLTTYKNEWGTIRIEGAFSLKYRYGKTEQEIPEEYANLPVKKAHAAGGWSAMDYYLEVESMKSPVGPPKQINKELFAKNQDGCENEKPSDFLDSFDPIWEARRYEIAKDIYLSLIKDEKGCQLDRTIAHCRAVNLADKLINELKKRQ